MAPIAQYDWPLPVPAARIDYGPAVPYNLALLSTIVPPPVGITLKIMTPGKVSIHWDWDFP